jgi:hypothetical protein
MLILTSSLSTTTINTQWSSIRTRIFSRPIDQTHHLKSPTVSAVTMAGIIDMLPPELRLHVAKFLPTCADILAIAQTSKQNYRTFNYLAYDLAASLPEKRGARIVLWAAAKGFARVIVAAHEANFDTDMWFTCWDTSTKDKLLDLLVVKETDYDPSITITEKWRGWLPFEGSDFDQLWPRRSIVCAPIHLAADADHVEATQLLLREVWRSGSECI